MIWGSPFHGMSFNEGHCAHCSGFNKEWADSMPVQLGHYLISVCFVNSGLAKAFFLASREASSVLLKYQTVDNLLASAIIWIQLAYFHWKTKSTADTMALVKIFYWNNTVHRNTHKDVRTKKNTGIGQYCNVRPLKTPDCPILFTFYYKSSLSIFRY